MSVKLVYGSDEFLSHADGMRGVQVYPVIPFDMRLSPDAIIRYVKTVYPDVTDAISRKFPVGLSLRKLLGRFVAQVDFLVLSNSVGERRCVGLMGSRFGRWTEEEVVHAAHSLKWFALKNDLRLLSVPAFGKLNGSLKSEQVAKIYYDAFGSNPYFECVVYMGPY